MGWERTLDYYGSLIEKRLKSYFSDLIQRAESYHSFVGVVYENFCEYSLRKGKRLASCSTLLSYKGYTSDIKEDILNVCVGIELYRHCILVHDDLVDKDNFRRGEKSFHKIFSKFYDRRFGEGVAVFGGDLIFGLALKSILTSGFPIGKIEKVVNLLVEGYCEVNESQILDLLFEYKDPDINDWSAMVHKRATSLFKASILTGAILGGAPEHDINLLMEVATNIGYSFDIQDDIIDTFATKDQYGRKPGRDIILGKKPLHIIVMRQNANKDELNLLNYVEQKGYITKAQLESIKDSIRRTGALKVAKEKSKKHGEIAKKLIAQTHMNNEIKDFFSSFVQYIEDSLEWYQ
ncbi:MAG: polyprenyl synthetase family protein [Candidatus Methylarchaceae archaeon HK01M]|nr:polyprenyl synthetase family protein [Candidatus Methylarchaceae archaeon HK01M]